jgi:hypothetical protein
LLDGIVARGATPIIFWQPTHPNVTATPTRYAFARIVAGDWDAYLIRWATAAGAWDQRLIVRWAHEMNGDWFPWAMGKVGNTPAGYVAAWRHIVAIIRPIAPKVRFMWCPNSPNAGMPSLASLYPGDAWVDMVAFDVYNWKGTTQTSMLRIYRAGVRGLSAVTAHKAIYVGETGISGPGSGRGIWLATGYRALYSTYPRFRGILYFQVDMTVGRQPDWRLLAGDGSLAAYRKLMADPRFRGKL